MNAEILAVGSELLTPQRSDTNSLWLTERLNAHGVEVVQKGVVGDDRGRLSQAVKDVLARSPILILTGGLGPTEDDITREAVADALGRKLTFHEDVSRWIEERFARMGRKMAEINRRQAFVVEGAAVLPNPNGTAPGLWLEEGARIVVLLPGPPRELKPMWLEHCEPRLSKMLPSLHLATRTYRVAGMGESDLDALIAPAYKPHTRVATTVLAAAGDIIVHLRAQAANDDEARTLVDEVGEKVVALLGTRIYAHDLSTMETVVGKMLEARGAKLAVAESCTGGLLGGRITKVPGASAWFLGGLQVYGREMKTRLLGLDDRMVTLNGVVSEAVAKAMADGARDRTGATYALSITGEAGPESSTPGVEVGTTWIGLAAAAGVEAKMFRFPGDRERIRDFAVQTALNMLRLKLMEG